VTRRRRRWSTDARPRGSRGGESYRSATHTHRRTSPTATPDTCIQSHARTHAHTPTPNATTERIMGGAVRWGREGGGETICPPRRWQFGRKSRRIYVRPRTGPQSAHLWWPAVAKLQAASVPIAIGSCAMGQTDGRIALLQNVPLGRGHNKWMNASIVTVSQTQ